MVHHARLWIVIIDGEHVRFLMPQPHRRELHEISARTSPHAGVRSSALGTDRPGRSFESVGATRHAIEPKHDAHERAKAAFLRAVAEEINRAAAEGRFDHLVVVAPVDELPMLTEALSAQASARVVGRLGKDLVKVPIHALPDHLNEWL
ncbi:host attachment protein [Acidisphaera rubrifaciens]|uniref:Host attachment protein n=1 Tax=Acidisphaera rubrifaciens HS-AP3 TaxID=1231350 RepID=A0A0D6P6F6_9PROT|nr:host attachment protein [Acidisphaera rubrifaciens]GAN76459.1 hypothetical protein Asru_0100_07 [Acidisphaera rubrifaciens HS-AP3]